MKTHFVTPIVYFSLRSHKNITMNQSSEYKFQDTFINKPKQTVGHCD